MVVVINTEYYLHACRDDYKAFIYESFRQLAKEQPQDTFIFLSTQRLGIPFTLPGNCQSVAIRRVSNAGFISTIWYNVKVASLLKKYKADVFVNGDGFCRPFRRVPECFILHEPESFSNPQFVIKNRLRHYSKNIPSFLRHAKAIVTNAECSKIYLGRYNTATTKTHVIYAGVKQSATPAGWEEKEKIKTLYAGGNEYFIFYGNTATIEMLLKVIKAFSHFKKWQKSGMHLLIVINPALYKDFTESIRLFKYRKDVTLFNNLPGPELEEIAAAAYCTIYLALYEGFSISALQSMKRAIPVITATKASVNEICGDAALYANFDDPDDIAKQLILIFKDENLRQALIEKGKERVKEYSWEKTAGLLWNCIVETVN